MLSKHVNYIIWETPRIPELYRIWVHFIAAHQSFVMLGAVAKLSEAKRN
jgi:hypothetical protein